MSFILSKGQKIFQNGKHDFAGAAKDAADCPHYADDYEEEWLTDDERSCYNCRYRRWTAESFTCMKKD